MSKPELTVIEGGLSLSASRQNKQLIYAYVTDTRLMGVLAVYASWKLSDTDSGFHQFFYIDCEESGFETYKSVIGSDEYDVHSIEQAIIGGLGAKKIEITKRQLQGLLTYYAGFNRSRGIPLPSGKEEYGFLIDPPEFLSDREKDELMKAICGEMTTNYQVINYFLMRCFGRDHSGASYLAADDVPVDLYDSYYPATFCKNVIDTDKMYADNAISYLCESLVEMNGNYETVISKVIVKDLRIVAFEKCSGFAVSAAEAAMMLAKPEFVTVYEVLLSNDDIDNNIDEFNINFNTVMSTHENGRMFMVFRKNNNHVKKRIFRLSNDVESVYYLTDFGQLIVAAYSLPSIMAAELKLRKSPLAPFLMLTSKYEFKESILLEFVQSDFEDFDEFLDFIKD